MNKIYQTLCRADIMDVSTSKVVAGSAARVVSDAAGRVISVFLLRLMSGFRVRVCSLHDCCIFAHVIPGGCSRESQPCKIQKRLGLPTETFGNDAGRTKRAGTAGFTLIELLVVVLIIGILAAAALPQYRMAVYKSRLGRLTPLMKGIKEANQLFFMANGFYTNDIAQWDISLPQGTTVTLQDGGKVGQILLPNGTSCEAVIAPVEGISLPRVQCTEPGLPVRLHVFYQMNEWLCYPGGTELGWRLCRSMGCSGEMPGEGQGCAFSL